MVGLGPYDSCAYRLTDWNGIDFDDTYQDTNGYQNLSLFYQGKQVEIGVNDDEDDDDE